jgi:leucyl aminopeptidase
MQSDDTEVEMVFPSLHARSKAHVDPVPSRARNGTPKIARRQSVAADAESVGVPVAIGGEVPRELGLGRKALNAAGFEGKVGQTLLVPRTDGPALIAFGIGDRALLDASKLRDAAAAFARTTKRHERITAWLPEAAGIPPATVAQALIEGAVLGRYRYRPLKRADSEEHELLEVHVVTGPTMTDEKATREVDLGIERARITARAVELARDLANAPGMLLSARKMAEIAETVAAETDLGCEIFDEEALAELGCGGTLGVNAGSVEPPRMIKLSYRPKDAKGRPIRPVGGVSLVGKGIMYDSGGISLKPNDLVHATMKVDMSGAAAVLAAMSTLSALGCKAAVTGYLMCTDNMPSGSAMKLGDVLTIRGGTTVEVLNTDAEGRLVLADGLVLSTEQTPKPDAIVDIATLTGACQRALGTLTAGLIGNDQPLIEQVKRSAERTDELVWQLPLDRRYRKELDSEMADLKNVGGENAGAITAALFLDEFVATVPWAHIDIAGTAQIDADDSWRSKGATGFGTRLLIDFLTNFTPPRQAGTSA